MDLTGNVCPPDHRHDETSTCYVKHRCRCDRCRERAVVSAKRYASGEAKPLHQVPCERCGMPRMMQMGARVKPLCRDCVYVLSREETAVWK